MTSYKSSQSPGLADRLGIKASASSLHFVLKSCLFVVSLAISSITIWQYTYKQQLNELKQSAQQDLALYGSKVKHELASFQKNLLLIIANHPKIQRFFNDPSGFKNIETLEYLQNLQTNIPDTAIFIGNAKQLLLASRNKRFDQSTIESHKKTISSRVFKNNIVKQFVFSTNRIQTKYLVVFPILKDTRSEENHVLGFIGLLIDISKLQEELDHSTLANQQLILASDNRGIIILSSEPDWLYRTFSNLPYSLKKSIDENFSYKDLFNQLGIANVDNGILTTAPNNNNPNGQNFLVHSTLLEGYPLRIHHLANINPIILRSDFYLIFFIVCIVSLTLTWFYLKEKHFANSVIIKHERALKDLELEFKQQQKLASLGMMATTIAHEINQPITAIKTETNIGSKYLQRSNFQEVSNSLTTIAKHTQLLATITSQLKNFARKRSANNFNIANIHQTLNHSLELNRRRLLLEKVEINIAKFDQSTEVRIDHHQLQQVFNNLLQNSCDAMHTTSHKRIDINVIIKEPVVMIHFADNGPGIPEPLLSEIFTPFVSSKEDTISMGLGLAICRDILTKVGGNIEVENNPLKISSGVSFRINLIKIIADNNMSLHCDTVPKIAKGNLS